MNFARHILIYVLLAAALAGRGSDVWAAKRIRHTQKSGGAFDHALTQIPAGFSALSRCTLATFSPDKASPASRAAVANCKRRIFAERDLASVLIQAPNPATAELLAQLGIPVIADVPPIVIISPQDIRP